MNKLYSIAVMCFFFSNCNTQSPISENKNLSVNMINVNTDPIITKLVEDHYGNLFNYMNHDQIINTVWEEAGGADKLKKILIDEEAPMKARFLVSEVLFTKSFGFVVEVGAELVAKIYANAMANNLTGMANSWGLLYEYNDEGPVGINWLLLREAAIPELFKLLDNETIHMYHGSEEATVGNSYQFRVKDFAAYYICKIKQIEAVYHETHAARDTEIEKLKILLAKDKK
ncbi:MAG: hypothetical protein JKY03_02200 [Aureispira sp.]|nr:hypothetical protein [Aureispira sp.]